MLVSLVLTVNMQHGLRMAHISVMKKTTVWMDMVFDTMEKMDPKEKSRVITCLTAKEKYCGKTICYAQKSKIMDGNWMNKR